MKDSPFSIPNETPPPSFAPSEREPAISAMKRKICFVFSVLPEPDSPLVMIAWLPPSTQSAR